VENRALEASDYLLTHNWDFMLIFESTTTLTPEFTSLIAHTHSISRQESDAFLSMLNLGSVQLQTLSQNSRISASP
jgi:hypothetical protein